MEADPEKARALLEDILARGGDRDRALPLLDRLDHREGALPDRAQNPSVSLAPPTVQEAMRAPWSRRALVMFWAVGFALLGAGVAPSWERFVGNLARTPLPTSDATPPSTSVAPPSASEGLLAEARTLLERGDASGALRALEGVSPEDPAYPLARQLKERARSVLLGPIRR